LQRRAASAHVQVFQCIDNESRANAGAELLQPALDILRLDASAREQRGFDHLQGEPGGQAAGIDNLDIFGGEVFGGQPRALYGGRGFGGYADEDNIVIKMFEELYKFTRRGGGCLRQGFCFIDQLIHFVQFQLNAVAENAPVQMYR